MRQETINIYTFEELSEDSKCKAINDYRENQDIAWGNEWMETLKVFCDLFDIELIDWAYGFYYGVNIRTNIEYLEYSEDFEITHRYLNSLGMLKECPLTGYCGDISLMHHLQKITKGKSRNRIEVLQECLDEWQSEFEKDIEFQESDEYISEDIIANEYEFLKDGNRY